MTRIIAGRFQTSDEADRAVRLLESSQVPADRISVFYVTSPGQHDATPVGGDQPESPGLEHAEDGALAGAAAGLAAGAAGVLIGATAGLAAPLIVAAGVGAAAAGAYGGSLAGAMSAAEDHGMARIRHAGMMVAVDAGAVATDVVALLRKAGAADIEEAQGSWANGTWDDFDATEPPKLVDGAHVPATSPTGR